MRRALTFVMSSMMSAMAFAQGAPSAKVVEYGIVRSVDGKFVFDRKTKRIPLRRDLRFGFCAEIVGLGADGKHTLAEVVRHPVLVQPNGVETNGWNVPRMVTVENGVARWCASHRFEHDWELVPGKWRFVVGDGERDLVIQEFDAVRGK
ncbi:MAG: DUF3859 domain-containing protein [Burkholderiales bacterium]|nr:DUF3859 domain-containing protein [Burkholderiales bacterium]